MKKMILTVTVFVFFLTAGVAYWGYSQYQHFATAPIAQTSKNAVVHIEQGSSVAQIAKALHQAGVLDQPDYFVYWVRWHKLGATLKAGEYRISSELTVTKLVELLQTGKSVQYPVTLVAGQTMQQFLQQLADLPHLVTTQDWLSAAGRKQLHQLLEQPLSSDARYPFANLEGRLLPETYFYQKGAKDIEVIQRAAAALKQVLAQAWSERQDDLPLTTPEQALILASIVEKETGHAPERAKIAGVFVNRLNRKMRLQTDPTVIYGIGAEYDGNIRKRDLRTQTPYNTYTIAALPPTPIAFASREAIYAVMHPETTKALYFVAKGGGQHYFSTTLQEHNRAVQKYILNR